MIKINLSPSLDVEVRHFAKTHHITVDEAISKILAIYLRGAKND